jgi:hypothetical protein
MHVPPDGSSWLRNVVSIQEALAHILRIEEMHRLLGHDEPVDYHSKKTIRQQFDEWIVAHFRSTDELWWYNTGGDSWANLAGECGYAIVRGGEVVTRFMIAEN